MEIEQVAASIVDAAVKIHRHLGPGLLESAYQACLEKELTDRGLHVLCEVPVPLVYEGMRLEVGFRLDMVVENCVVIENKAADALLPIHTAQMITYLKLSGKRLGFLINWNVPMIKEGLKRVVL